MTDWKIQLKSLKSFYRKNIIKNTLAVLDLLCQNFNLFSGQKLISCDITRFFTETSFRIKSQYKVGMLGFCKGVSEGLRN